MPVDVASGAVYSSHGDFRCGGSFPLAWKRSYHTALTGKPISPLGPGWTSPYYSRLTRLSDGFHFIGPDGSRTRFPDPGNAVERGGVLRQPGSFLELAKRGVRLAVTSWNPDSGEVVRYLFQGGRSGDAWPLRAIENASGHGLDLAWDSEGRLQGVRQRLEGRTLLIAHSAEGRIASVAYLRRDGVRQPVARYEYDAGGRLAAAHDARGFTDRYEYDEAGRMVREILKDGGIFRFRYDEKGRCIRTWGLDDYDLKSIRYLDAIGWTEVTDSLGHVTRYQWLPTGQVIQRINPLGGVTRTEYDGEGRIAKVTGPSGGGAAYVYDGDGNRVKTVDALGNAWEYGFNADHLVVSATDPAGNGWRRVYEGNRLKSRIDPLGGAWKYAHDAAGRVVGVENPAGARMEFRYAEDGSLESATDWAGNTTGYLCDELGRVIGSVNPAGEQVRKAFDIAGNLLSLDHPAGGRFDFTHDPKGRITSVTDGNGRRATRTYGPCGRLVRQQDAAGEITLYAWGSEPGRLLRVTLDGGDGPAYSYAYDALGKVVEETGFDGRRILYRRDVAGNCIGMANGAGEEVEYALDALGRVVRRTFPDGSAVEFAYDPIGRLQSAANADIALAFDRDPLGRVVRETQGDAILEYAYDAAGALEEVRGPLGYRIAYGRREDGSLQEARIRDAWTVAFGDGGPGRARRILPGGAVLDFRFDAMAAAIVQTFSPPGGGDGEPGGGGRPTEGFTRAFRHREDGALVSVEDTRKGATAYAYDGRGRIVSVQREGGESDRYRYAASGDLIGIAAAGSRPITLEYGDGNRLARRDDRRYDYDAQGRLVSTDSASPGDAAGAWTFRWDPLDQLREAVTPAGERWTYAYDPLGRRISKTGPDGTERFVWDRHVIIQGQREGAQSFAWSFPPEGFSPLGKEADGRFFAALPDHLGTPLELVDDEGGIRRSLEFDLYGGLRRSEGDGPDSEWRFPGQWFDAETRFHYNRFRYYDPGAGRYLSQDPLRLMAGKNLYAYGRDPLNWFDPFGLATLFRGMLRDSEGNPIVHSGANADGRNAANSLGVRPGESGMSTSLDPAEIQEHRRPRAFGGTQGPRNDPDQAGMFAIDTEVLAQHGLVADNDHDSHVNITTAPGIDPAELPERLAATREHWEQVTPEQAAARRAADAAADGDGEGGCGG